MPKRWPVVVAAVAVLAVLAAGALLVARRPDHRPGAGGRRSPRPAPSRLSWTDWAAVRPSSTPTSSASSTPSELEDFLDEGFDADLTSTLRAGGVGRRCSTSGSASPPRPSTGSCSASRPTAPSHAPAPRRRPTSTSSADSLEELGYDRPDDEDGVWVGGADLLPEIGPDLTPELQYVALDADDHLVLTSDSAAFLEQALDERRRAGSRASTRWSAASGEPLSAAIYTGDPRLPGAGDGAGRRRATRPRPTS